MREEGLTEGMDARPSCSPASGASSCNTGPRPSFQYLSVDLLVDRALRFLLFLHSQKVYQGPNGHALEGRWVSGTVALLLWQGGHRGTPPQGP